MDLKDFAKSISMFAPLLGSVLPIPGGEAIGELIAHAFGGNHNDLNDLHARILADSSSALKLIEIENNTKVQLQQLIVQNTNNKLQAKTVELENERLDRVDARKNVPISKMPAVMTFIIIVGFFTTLSCLIIYGSNIQPEISSVLYMMVGTINTAFGSAFAFWLGSSASSRNKDAAIHKTLTNLSGN